MYYIYTTAAFAPDRDGVAHGEPLRLSLRSEPYNMTWIDVDTVWDAEPVGTVEEFANHVQCTEARVSNSRPMRDMPEWQSPVNQLMATAAAIRTRPFPFAITHPLAQFAAMRQYSGGRRNWLTTFPAEWQQCLLRVRSVYDDTITANEETEIHWAAKQFGFDRPFNTARAMAIRDARVTGEFDPIPDPEVDAAVARYVVLTADRARERYPEGIPECVICGLVENQPTSISEFRYPPRRAQLVAVSHKYCVIDRIENPHPDAVMLAAAIMCTYTAPAPVTNAAVLSTCESRNWQISNFTALELYKLWPYMRDLLYIADHDPEDDDSHQDDNGRIESVDIDDLVNDDAMLELCEVAPDLMYLMPVHTWPAAVTLDPMNVAYFHYLDLATAQAAISEYNRRQGPI